MKKVNRGYNRTRYFTVRLSEIDHRRLVERAVRAGAKTPSAYLRAACLTGQEFELPAWEHLRALINALNENTYEVRRAGGWSKDMEAKADAAYDAISRIGT